MFRRLFAIAVLAVAPNLKSAPVHAQVCSEACARYVTGLVEQWNEAVQVTLERQFYGGVISNLPYARCVSHHESHGSYTAQNAHSSASGRYQFLDSTWRTVALARGRPDLPARAADAVWFEQEASFAYAWTHPELGGPANWYGTGCY